MLVLPQRKPQTQEGVVVSTSALSNYDLWQRSFFWNEKNYAHGAASRDRDIFVAIVTLAKTMAFNLGDLSLLWASTRDPEKLFYSREVFSHFGIGRMVQPFTP